MRVRKGFVTAPHGQVHYRIAGHGPPVVLLHESPRSSAMNVPLLEALGEDFSVIALDTPGYGGSDRLPVDGIPGIGDYAAALEQTLTALGIEQCPLYGLHTSAKIILQLAVDHPERVALAILDGLSLPAAQPDEAYIARYTEPFTVSSDGSHFAAVWTRIRDMYRFFPWFDTSVAARQAQSLPDDVTLHAFALDMLAAGPRFSDGYYAAMHFQALPLTRIVRARTVFMCRQDDLLFPSLDALPSDLPEQCTVERIPADRDTWRRRIRELLLERRSHALGVRIPDPLARPSAELVRGYVGLSHGQIHVRRKGIGSGRPLLLLHETPGAAVALDALLRELCANRTVFAIDLPGQGESDPLPNPDALHYAESLVQLLDVLALTSVDVYAELTSVPLALELARIAGNRVHRLVFDGVPMLTATERRGLWKQCCPALQPRWDGTHFLTLWHRLRDQELSWPWYDRSAAAVRVRQPAVDAERLHALTVELAKQPAHYGEACLAAVDYDVATALDTTLHDVLILNDEQDVRYSRTAKALRRLRKGVSAARAVEPDARAARVLQFLDDDGRSA